MGRLTQNQRAALGEWVRRLRTPDRIQGKGSLHTEVQGVHHYDCLGVGCEIAAEKGVVKSRQNVLPLHIQDRPHAQAIVHAYGDEAAESISTMPPVVRRHFGIDAMTMNRLIHMNDKAGMSFRAIADFLEQEFLSDHDTDPRPANVDPAEGAGPRSA
jgi:hypothetical protein